MTTRSGVAVQRHVVPRDQPELHRGDYKQTESFSNTAGDSVSVPFTGTAIQWVGSKAANHGLADVYLDGVKEGTVDTYGSESQAALYSAKVSVTVRTPSRLL